MMSFPPATEMFQFAGFASQTYVFGLGCRRSGGLPHSEIHGSKLAHSSPRLIAARHVLHRLSTPRHSPNALETLERAIVHASRQDIGRAKQRLPRSTQKNYHVLCIIRSRPAPGQGRNLADRQPRRKKTSSQFQRPWQPSPEPKSRQTRKPRTRPFPATKPPTPLAGGTSRQYRPPSIGGTAGAWWSRTGSNRRPEACKATALPTELRPLDLPPAIRGRVASKIPAPGARRENGGPR